MIKVTKEFILIDFDVMVVHENLVKLILNTASGQKWHYYQKLFLDKKLSLEETLIKQYSLIRAPKQLILNEIDKMTTIRKYFPSLLEFCLTNNIKFKVISSGLDFVIQHILEEFNLPRIEINAFKTNYDSKGFLHVSRPYCHNNSIKDFKLDQVLYYKKQKFKIFYIGGGVSDFEAATAADIVFSVKNSALTKYCVQNKLYFIEFYDFIDIIESFQIYKFLYSF